MWIHILPYSRTLDDSFANRTLCLRKANRDKGNYSPFEAWGNTPHWDDIQPLIAHMPQNKRWRFAPDAMERFEDEREFLDRQLVDTQYLSRLAREYLSCLYPEKGSSPVYVVPGRMTEMLRRHWGLNFDLSVGECGTAKRKDRTDHRHHAIDAAVVGATDRSLIQKIQKASRLREQQGLEDVIGEIDPPFPGFREAVRAQLDRIIVSHRADHGRIDIKARRQGRDSTTGQLHNDTAYGPTGEVSESGVPIVVTRKPLLSLTAKDLPKIKERDKDLHAALWEATRDLQEKGQEKEFQAALATFSSRPGPYQGIRRVRIAMPLNTIPVRDRSGRIFKCYKGDSNHCYEIWRMPDGKWQRMVYTTFEAHQPDLVKKPHPAAKKLMRLHKKDMVELDHPKLGRTIMVIAQLSEQRLDLIPPNEADADRRKRDPNDPLDYFRASVSSLQKYNLRKLLVDETGFIRR